MWFGAWRNLALQFWDSTASLADIEAATRAVVELSKRTPDGVVSLSVLRANGVPKLGDAERKRAGELVTQLSSVMRMGVQIIETEGFTGAFLRSVVSGINQFSRTPMRVFAHTDEANKFLLDQRLVRASQAEINEAVRFGRDRWERRASR